MTGPLLVLGEALVDLIPAPADGAGGGRPLVLAGWPGGGPANIAVGLARLGVPVLFAGRFSRAGLGPWRRRQMLDEGVDLAPSVASDRPTTLAAVTLDPSGAATYDFYGPETADWWWDAGELPAPAALAGGAVHTGSLVAAIEPGAAAVQRWVGELRRSGEVAVSYDPNVRPNLVGGADRCRQAAAAMLPAAHLVKVSSEDLAVLVPGEGAERAARRWLAPAGGGGPHLVVVTDGARGATCFHRDGRKWHRPPAPTTVVDTVGAGDAFAAGLLAWLHDSGLLTPGGLAGIGDSAVVAALDQANAVAALTCARRGADPPRRADLRRWPPPGGGREPS